MKTRLLSFIVAVLLSLPIYSANFYLGDLPEQGWDANSTYNPQTKVINYVKAWGGIGWWFNEKDISDYTTFVLSLESSEIDAQIVLEYLFADGTVTNDINPVSKNDNLIEIKLKKEELSSSLRQIYIQSKEAGSMVLKEAYFAEQNIAYTEKEIPVGEDGSVLLSELEKYDSDCRVELRINVKTSGSTAPGWGIGRITALGSEDNDDNMLNCIAISDEGEENIFRYTIGKLISIAKSDGEGNGIYINIWTGELTGLYAMVIGSGEGESEGTDDGGIVIPTNEYGGVLLSDIEKYDDDRLVKITIIATSSEGSEAGPGWGIAAICPYGKYDTQNYVLECISITPEGSENVYSFSISELKEFSKFEGVVYTDEWGNQGITINTWGVSSRKDIKVYPQLSVTTIPDISSESERIIAVEYYNLQGMKLSQPESGINLRKEKMSNGTCTVKKIYMIK